MASPTHLRAAADALRRTAAAIHADVPGVASAGDTETWVGPAATQFRLAATRAEERADDVGHVLRTVADRLDDQALHVERAEALERADARARERERERARARQRAREGSGPPCPRFGRLSVCQPAPRRTRGHG